ncbi:MAG TPA: DUF1156 domain-containing protein, partial [Anaerolineae bacterium]|nr:DUF1156 domain-containing protein [Anaerolineae bacterium]
MEDYLPIREISAEAAREKSIRHGHISTLHLWWARRPLVNARAAVYSALAPIDRRESSFLQRLCSISPESDVLESARQNVLEEHVQRLSKERGRQISVDQVSSGRVPPPRVLDMFAGGASIPLEAMRLGAETYALDLNPVAYLIEMCAVRYPQLYGHPSDAFRGTGKAQTWDGLAAGLRFWAKWVQDRVQKELGHLYSSVQVSRSAGGRGYVIPV